MRAPKEVLHKLQVFMELLQGGFYRAVTNTPPPLINQRIRSACNIEHDDEQHTKPPLASPSPSTASSASTQIDS